MVALPTRTDLTPAMKRALRQPNAWQPSRVMRALRRRGLVDGRNRLTDSGRVVREFLEQADA